ncbi:MAG: metallophosphoesterase [Muribaculaceae bacterium]|nr:metallophosphoesterase [Muribaculaceae bacterium]
MRVSIFLLLTLLVINLAIDWYIYRQVTHRCKRPVIWGRAEMWSAILFSLLLIAGIIIPAREGSNNVLLAKMWLIFTYGSVYIPKAIGVIFDLVASVPRLFGHRRIKPVTVAGIILAVILFGAIWWGAAINRFAIDNREVEIEMTDLPESFDGYRIAQFSDLHTGTYGNDTTYVSRLVDNINSLDADLIVFTGDIVNRRSEEIGPFINVIRRLHAPDGVIAILGNHDYGDYMTWPSEDAKRNNMQTLHDAYDNAGIRLLLNETEWIRRGNDSIAIIGVENIGDPPFPVYGSLTKAYPTPDDATTKILLSHNPAHWVDSISGNDDVRIQLTLSGHTHAMQIEMFGLSPAALRYKTWGGLYADPHERHQLYVNIGAGTVGLPMRLGATPEVTLLTLRRRR